MSSLSTEETTAAGVLYVVATPLGNLEDITLRALRVLKEVSLIAAEDTRHSRTLLVHFGISTPLTSYHDHNERQKAPALLERLRGGESIALISDAGTPGIADPGYRLVTAAIGAGIRVVPVPGANAIVSALCVGGLPTDRFRFEGFVPEKSGGRRAFFESLRSETATIVCYESARRLEACLREARAVLGNRPAVVARELTKVFEEIRRGTLDDLLEAFARTPARGEVTMLIGGAAPEANVITDAEIRKRVLGLRATGVSVREASRRVAAESGRAKNEVYRIAVMTSGEDL